jgi:hypothetical protein
MQNSCRIWFAAGLVIAAFSLTGCDMFGDPDSHELTNKDFAGPAAPQPTTQAAGMFDPTAGDTPLPRLSARSAKPESTTPAGVADPNHPEDEGTYQEMAKLPRPNITAVPVGGTGYTMDAMVGQVNGNAIYASTVFEPINEQLAAMGKRESRPDFSGHARKLIASRLDAIVADALILGEAERDLNEQERKGLEQVMREKREELLRKYGEGSEAIANEQSNAREGKTIDQQLLEERQKLLIQRYYHQKFAIRINVTRRDIERYYVTHMKDYNRNAYRTLRMISTPADQAEKVEAYFKDGKSFTQVAATPLNRYHSDRAGLLADKVEGNQYFDAPELNAAMTKLKTGETSPKIVVNDVAWWIHVETYEPAVNTPLLNVQLDIEELLRRQRFQYLSMRYREALYENGSFNPIEQMTDSLLGVAVSRYSVQP